MIRLEPEQYSLNRKVQYLHDPTRIGLRSQFFPILINLGITYFTGMREPLHRILLTLLLLPKGLTSIHFPQHGISLPYRPVASKRVSTINFITKTLTLTKEYNLRAHEKYFNDIVALWTAIFLEHELTKNPQVTPIQQTNPGCSDLRAIVMDAIKSVSELLNANFFIRTKRQAPLYQESAAVTINLHRPKTKRSFILKSALSLVGSHLASQVFSDFGSNRKGLIPIGGSVLAPGIWSGQTGRSRTQPKKNQNAGKSIHRSTKPSDTISEIC